MSIATFVRDAGERIVANAKAAFQMNPGEKNEDDSQQSINAESFCADEKRGRRDRRLHSRAESQDRRSESHVRRGGFDGARLGHS